MKTRYEVVPDRYYIITDPCYILSDDVWNKIFSDRDDYREGEFQEIMKTRIKDELSKVTKNCLGVEDTGYGDWNNKIDNTAITNDIKIINRRFCADAGLVCVVEVENLREPVGELKITDDMIQGESYTVAIVESFIPLIADMDTRNPDWTIVQLKDTWGQLIAETEKESDDNYFDDYEDDWDDEE